ncbi:galactose mutarotase-like enzyme [Hephaestia caeni]|uniref:Galactose mutarotase-like enzyme n=1 Tax=Hephaestia caeni TaxID=645617 RepID=A0A397PBX2_9SPHN|nr:aldose 1-epimerase family protein [Hephaestia caeni]RIA44617.1 galactose mutarotase-like enzyme [Hephaestia caeni]
MTDLVEIASDGLLAAINPFGAELTHLRDTGRRELMSDADPAFWSHTAPILFPVIGVTNGGVIRVDGTAHPMPKHGFARHSTFDVVRHERDRAVFRLADSEATRQHYPFAFRLDIDFALYRTRLTVEARITNRGERPMPAQFGFHPALAWPLPFGAARDEHIITFDADEPERLLRIAPDGLIAPERRDSPLDGRSLHLDDALFTDDALVWDPVHSDKVRYGPAEGAAIEMGFPDTPRLGVWTKPGARFVCIEPWHGLADLEGFAGELRDKPGAFVVAPGEDKRLRMSIALST